ncbi:MAG: HK97 family phage prohead protease [Solirubrobacteraceae bacterium]
MSTTRPKPGEVEQRTMLEAPGPTVDGRRLHGVIPYSVESRDLGGWREIIEPGALAGADLTDLIATVDHAGIPIGRFPTTLEVDDQADGLHWSVSLPESRADLREAVERGDLRAGSWRMVVKRDEYRGDLRHIHEIAELRDVSIVSSPAYPSAATEYRSSSTSEPPATEEPTQEAAMQPESTTGGTAAPETTTETATIAAPETTSTGSLRVEDRSGPNRPARGLAEAFREAGFPGETATVDFGEFRAATFTGSVDTLAPGQLRSGVNLGADERYAWPVFPQTTVEAAETAVRVLRQSARTIPAAATVIRAIDAVTAKPEVSSVLEIITEALKQVAAIQSNVPNVYLEQAAFNTTIEGDLRLTLNEALDKLVLDKVAASGFQAPGTDPLLISIRKAISTIQGAGYSPDTLILRPADAEALDTLRATGNAAEQYYVFAPAQLAPRSIFGLRVRISKTAAAPVVTDSSALGRLYVSPISLARFEVDAGATNRSNVRLEGHAAFGVERQAAAIRIAAA